MFLVLCIKLFLFAVFFSFLAQFLEPIRHMQMGLVCIVPKLVAKKVANQRSMLLLAAVLIFLIFFFLLSYFLSVGLFALLRCGSPNISVQTVPLTMVCPQAYVCFGFSLKS